MLIAAENHNWTQWLLCYTLWHMFLIAHRIPLHSVVLMRGWKFPASISFALLPNHKSKIYRWRSFTTTRVYSKRRALLRISHERIPFKTSAPLILINPPESETWTDRQRGETEKIYDDLPTWVMTHSTLCSSSWTDISSSLSQHSISGCGLHPLFSWSLFVSLSLSAATPPLVTLPPQTVSPAFAP